MAGRILNGVSAQRLIGAVWRKSRHSGAVGNCVELAAIGNGDVAVRNSRDPHGPALVYSWDEMAAFFTSIRGGEFHGIQD